jgi:hypothetical protein
VRVLLGMVVVHVATPLVNGGRSCSYSPRARAAARTPPSSRSR